MCHFGGPVKGIMQEVEGFDGRFIECLNYAAIVAYYSVEFFTGVKYYMFLTI
jgi:hypothetical protein